MAGAASTAAIAALEVSKAVRMKGVEAPDGDSSFVALDQERRGLVDEDGLPVVYDKDLIEKYWFACPLPISRWLWLHPREYIVRLCTKVPRRRKTHRRRKTTVRGTEITHRRVASKHLPASLARLLHALLAR